MTAFSRTLDAVAVHVGAGRVRHGRPDDGRTWVGMAELADPGRARAQLDRLRRGSVRGGDEAVAGAYLSIYVAMCALGPLVIALGGLGRGWLLDPEAVLLRERDGGGFDGVAFLETALLTLPGDDAGPHAVTCRAPDDLDDRVAASTVAAFSPVFAAIRTGARYGVAGMWGQLADEIYLHWLTCARAYGLDHRYAWTRADRFVDAVAGRAPQLRVRARAVPDADGTGGLSAIKGTCCLHYRTVTPVDLGSACTSCPLRLRAGRRG